MAIFELAGFFAFALAASATPGPNNVLLTALGASVGMRRGLPALFGIAFGFAVMIFLASLGVGQLIVEAGSEVTAAMRLTGVAILSWLAWQIATASVEEGGALEDRQSPKVPRFGNFLGAAMFQWVNPKAWVICASAMAAYLDVSRDMLTQAATFALTFVFAGLAGCLPWLALGTLAGRYIRGRHARIFNCVMAGVLLASIVPVVILEQAQFK